MSNLTEERIKELARGIGIPFSKHSEFSDFRNDDVILLCRAIEAAVREKVAQLEGAAAEYQRQWFKSHDDLAAAQAVIEQMREALKAVVDDADECQDADGWLCFELSAEAFHNTDAALSLPTNLDQLHEDRARECERLKVICEEGFSEFLPNTGGQYALKCMADILSQEAAAHRARKEGK